MSETHLSAVVRKPRTDVALASLRSEGVYDDSRSIYECGDESVAIPVTSHPVRTEVREVIRETGPPRLNTLEDHLAERGWTDEELEDAPRSWAVVGSVILVEATDVPRPEDVGDALLALHGQADTVLARGGIDGPHREPTVTVVAGEGDTETVHVEHGTTYAMDLAEVMFSPGNKAERARMGEVVRDDGRVLDAFAGIGYFALPMARAGASVTAVERNPAAFQYLLENAMRNEVQDRIAAYRGDNRDVVPELAADDASFDRICMGHYDAYESLPAVLPALESGGTVHLHEATPEALVPDRPVERLEAAAADLDRSAQVEAVRTVKTHSEGVEHVVVDATID